MLNPEGKIVGEFSISRIGDEEFFLFGSQAAEIHHPRWFLAHMPANSQIRFETLALSMVGLTVAKSFESTEWLCAQSTLPA